MGLINGLRNLFGRKKEPWEALHQMAAEDAHTEILRRIIIGGEQSPDNINVAISPLGRTPLHAAADAGAIRAARVLTQTMPAALVAQADSHGSTALHAAAGCRAVAVGAQHENPHPQMVGLLAYECAGVIDVTHRDVRLRTVLHWLAAAPDPTIALKAIEALLEAFDRLEEDERKALAAPDPAAKAPGVIAATYSRRGQPQPQQPQQRPQCRALLQLVVLLEARDEKDETAEALARDLVRTGDAGRRCGSLEEAKEHEEARVAIADLLRRRLFAMRMRGDYRSPASAAGTFGAPLGRAPLGRAPPRPPLLGRSSTMAAGEAATVSTGPSVADALEDPLGPASSVSLTRSKSARLPTGAAGSFDEFVKKRRLAVEARLALADRAAEIVAAGPRRPPLGSCMYCFDDLESVFYLCGHACVCPTCFLGDVKAKMDLHDPTDVTARGVLACTHPGCDHFPSWRLAHERPDDAGFAEAAAEPAGGDGLFSAAEVAATLRAAAALVPSDEDVSGRTPAWVVERWEWTRRTAIARERADRVKASLQADPTVRFCRTKGCPDHRPETAEHAEHGLTAYSRGYVLDPPPLPPKLAALKRLVLTPLSFGALSVAVVAAILLELPDARPILLWLLPRLPFATGGGGAASAASDSAPGLWMMHPPPPPPSSVEDGVRHAMLACALLGCACAWLLGPRADRFGLEEAARADLRRLRVEVRQAEATVATVQAEIERLQRQRQPSRNDRNTLQLAETRLTDAVTDLSTKEAALHSAQADLATRGDELRRDVGEAIGRVAQCPTCAKRQCFDCGVDFDASGHRLKTCEQVDAESADPATRKKQEEKKRREAERLQALEQEAARKAEEEAARNRFFNEQFNARHNDSHGWKPCPACEAPINKTAACLHMDCRNCGAKFCWSCGDYRPRGSSYSCGSGSCRNGVRQWWQGSRRQRRDGGGAAAALTREEAFRRVLKRRHGRARLAIWLVASFFVPAAAAFCDFGRLAQVSTALGAAVFFASLLDMTLEGEIRTVVTESLSLSSNEMLSLSSNAARRLPAMGGNVLQGSDAVTGRIGTAVAVILAVLVEMWSQGKEWLWGRGWLWDRDMEMGWLWVDLRDSEIPGPIAVPPFGLKLTPISHVFGKPGVYLVEWLFALLVVYPSWSIVKSLWQCLDLLIRGDVRIRGDMRRARLTLHSLAMVAQLSSMAMLYRAWINGAEGVHLAMELSVRGVLLVRLCAHLYGALFSPRNSFAALLYAVVRLCILVTVAFPVLCMDTAAGDGASSLGGSISWALWVPWQLLVGALQWLVFGVFKLVQLVSWLVSGVFKLAFGVCVLAYIAYVIYSSR